MRATPIDEGFELSDEIRDWAERTVPQVKVEVEFEKFKDYWLANGKPMANWNATLRNWLRRCVEFKGAALYTADEMQVKKLMEEYTAKGFRRAYTHENAVLYRVAFDAWEQKQRQEKPRDMSMVTQLVARKSA